MATYEFNDKVKFILPSGYIFSQEEDEEGNEFVRIFAGEFQDDEGTCYRFNCKVTHCGIEPQDGETITRDNLLDVLAGKVEPCRKMKLPGKPNIMLLNKATPLAFFGRIMKAFVNLVFIQLPDLTFLQFFTSWPIHEEDPSVDAKFYDYLCDVLKATRINGRKLPVETISPVKLQEALELTFDENGEAVMDISPKIQFNFAAGEETTTYEYTSEGMKVISPEGFRRVYPDERLYPHYNSLRSEAGSDCPGVTVVGNASGTEYSFIPFRRAAENGEVDGETKALYNRIIEKDTAKYDLYKKAKEMQPLFHVNESAFDSHHDRECELEEGLMHRAYMMSGLRSFAWTLADYCKEHDCTPKEVDGETISKIVDFVADAEWLNYDGETYCKGLCAGSDLHVFFIPKEVSQADRKKLLPSKEDVELAKQMKENFPAYSEILSEVHSLNNLRKDLKYIYPAIHRLWEQLAEGRNYDEPLLGNAADIVYAWCALALAAKEPFFTEDGPMSCFFTYPTAIEVPKEKAPSPKKSSGSKSGSTKVTKEEWETDEYGYLIDYQVTKKEIILPDGITGIEEDLFLCNEDITSVVIPEGVDTIANGAFWMCYNLKKVDFPSTLRIIGENAFNSCEQLTSIVIPDGCDEIQEDAFTGCKKLKDIYVPDSLSYIGEDAFCTFNENTVIHTPKGSLAESFAREHGWKVDHKAAPGSSKTNDTRNVAETEDQQLSAEDMETLGKIMNEMSDIQNQLAESQAGISKFGDYLERKEAREKAAEAEKDRKKAEAVAAGKSEKDIVNMYVILTNEQKLGKLQRPEEAFYELYEEDFAALSKDEVIQIRKDMLSEMQDASRCNYYAEKFKKRSVEERFAVSTGRLNDVNEDPEIDLNAKWAIENSKEWYDPSEYAEVRRLMDADLANLKKQLDDQLTPIDAAWTRFATGKEFLQIVIKDKATDGSDLQVDCSNFQIVIGQQIVSVEIASKGIFRMSSTIMNCFTWYWHVTVRDIWEAAGRNELRDEREGAYEGAYLADQALNQIRVSHPETKATSPAPNNLRTTTAPSHHTTAAKTVSTSTPQTPAAKKEGCYIATAVYGSYDAPEVMTLRRFRDETLKKSAFGRWFIRTYYRLSPPVAARLKYAKHINAFVRAILDKWVARLDRK